MKTMRRGWTLLLLAALLWTMSGCTGAQGRLGRGETVAADLGDYHVEVVGVEAFSDTKGQPSMRVYYGFTNNSDEAVSGSEIDVSARECGIKLGTTYASYEDDAAEYGNQWLSVYPGVTIRCVEEFNYIPWFGTVAVTLEDWWSGDSLTVTFKANELPGAPAEAYSIEQLDDPHYTEGWDTEGRYLDGYFRMLDYEVVPAESYSDYDRVIRFRFEYSNCAQVADRASANAYFRAYQDGVELPTDYAAIAIDEERMFRTNIEPGETAVCAVSFALRSDSPVELVLDENACIGLRADIDG